MCEDLAGDGVQYAELRFCPQLHTREGLSADEVTRVVASAFREQQLGGGIILSALRSRSDDDARQLALLAEKRDCVGFDVAGNEQVRAGRARAARGCAPADSPTRCGGGWDMPGRIA